MQFNSTLMERREGSDSLPRYQEVAPAFNAPELEQRILKLWRKQQSFEKRRELNLGKAHWSFIDGPVTANNPLGVHHAWGRTYKDLYQRFWTMRGRKLRYQNGFDCQGLWVEVEVEKELGFKSKRDIEGYGIAEFIKKCKQRVLKYAAVQTEQSIRLGYWMDWNNTAMLRTLADRLEHPEQKVTVDGPLGPVTDTVEQIVGRLGTPKLGGSYFTFSNENNYTIWSVLKECHGRGWVYKGRDVMPWCPRCSTALSQHEIATEGYRELSHLSPTLRFPLRERRGEALLVWTTTPWTLTANVAAAVHPDLTYVKVLFRGEVLYLAESALERVFSEKPDVLGRFQGRELEGLSYDGPFDELPAEVASGAKEAHRVVLWDAVSQTEGTGIVHIAPGCGQEDFELSKKPSLPVVAPLDEYGVFVEGYGWLTGRHVYDSALPIIEDLKKKGILFKTEDYAHRYPVCWRCGSELVFRIVEEWFISMGKKLEKPLEEISESEKKASLRYQIMDVTKQIQWIPDFGLQQELDWLVNMQDWMISKKRYWGLALPIWECKSCGHFEVIGSEEELKSKAVEGWEVFEGHTPHRPWIDAVKIRCPNCGEKVSRIPDVGNPWLDAGIVAYSTLGYRGNRDYWAGWFPADLITECWLGQFRNWFYSMLTMSTILERKAPFRTCLGHGLVLAEDGREMHKSWGNAIWFDDAVENMGADVMRWMYCRNAPDTNMLFGYGRAEETKRQFFLPLWNIYSFFVTYANLDDWSPEQTSTEFSLLDRWILSRLQSVVAEVTVSLEGYNAPKATEAVRQFLEQLSTWYIRRSRRRFWRSKADEDKRAAYTTLYRCLSVLVRVLAPFVPFVTEELYQNIVVGVDRNAPSSVHHNDWPVADASLVDGVLERDMALVLTVSSLGRAVRSSAGVKLRQPLHEAKVVSSVEAVERLRPFVDLIKEELNVRNVVLSSEEGELVARELNPLPSVLGKKYGRLFPEVRAAVSRLDADEASDALTKGLPIEVSVGGKVMSLLPGEVEVRTRPREGYRSEHDKGIVVGLNMTLSEELAEEGLAKDIVRRIQNQRKNAGFDISDKIIAYYQAGNRLREVLETFREYIAEETLSEALYELPPPEGTFVENFNLAGETLIVGLVLSSVKGIHGGLR